MSKVRWGIISTAKIGWEKVIPAMQQSDICEITAISSRDKSNAEQWAQKLGIPKAYGSYEELLADPDIDAVYNPLPNHLHVPWSLKAIEAGKHVLVEKSIALSSEEAQKLVDAANANPQLKMMECFMYRHHPQWVTAKRIIKDGGIGELRVIQSLFSYFNVDPQNVRNQADIGGGAMLDIGCYNVSLSRFIFDEEPNRVAGFVEYDDKLKIDRLASGILEFNQGISSFVCCTQLQPYQRVNIFGTEGRVEIDIPFNAPPDRPCTMRHQQGDTINEIELDVCDQYKIQGDLFSKAILEDKPVPTPIEDACYNMKTIEAIFNSGKSGKWEDVAK